MTETDAGIGVMLRETADRVSRDHCGAAALRDADQGTWPAAIWAAVTEAGLPNALVPEAAGGFGVTIQDALSLLRVAGFHALPVPLAETMLAGWLLAEAGLAIPDGALTVGPVRPGEALALRADGGRWHVSGTLTRIPWAGQAAGLAALVPHDGGYRVVLLTPDALTVEAGENVAREPRNTVRVDGIAAAVAPTRRDPAWLRAVGAAMRTQQIAGAMTRLTEMTTEYAQGRVQFGRPIGKFQAVQQNLAVLAGQTAASVAAADIAAEAVAAGTVLSIAAGKARAGEAAGIGASIAHQVHGAIGFTFEHSLHFLTRRLWSWRDEFGKDAEWNALLGRHMAKAGADQVWAEMTAA
ncbi:acyl-CoA dehydrogenase family protein [Rhodopila sp.]|jgi:acyl-CoA dehydrogenase|uniref:acyl-CoA dehydrogenase family protein n=1 Tax=Rhodopila sp. TaxID=2480087 RepID=UPI002B9696B3|nr:acyl-CoA dehydrogenase family protein [Rhodopila sp.]HVZ07039.1 acyl-CoA dehydrogenase family protein [Rhodopila sp.]